MVSQDVYAGLILNVHVEPLRWRLSEMDLATVRFSNEYHHLGAGSHENNSTRRS